MALQAHRYACSQERGLSERVAAAKGDGRFCRI